MSYRPYPNADRALAQIGRHGPVDPPTLASECLRPVAAAFEKLRGQRVAAPTLGLSAGEMTRRAAEARRRLAVLEPEDDATGLIQEIGDEQGYVELPVDEYRLSTRPRVVSGAS